MYLSRLKLAHFRNYTNLNLSFSPGLNVVYGNNAQGKTNLLEAIYFLATGRSHRTSRDSELIQDGQTELLVQATVARSTGELFLELGYGLERRKQLRINQIPEKRVARLVGSIAAVLFSPDDLQLVKGPPGGRRRFMDIELSQISQTYLHHLISYNKVLAQRNVVLKSGHSDKALLEIYEQQLIEYGSQIVIRRREAVQTLSGIAERYHGILSEGKEHLRIVYQNSLGLDAESQSYQVVADGLTAQFSERRSEEVRRQTTLVGPHRDDLSFFINEKDVRLFASQGQQRTVVLALKLAELEYMHEQIGEPPVLLLDDVASELDPQRRHYLLSTVQSGIQTFISCTDLEDLLVRQWPPDHALFRVDAGSVTHDERGLS